MTLHIVYRQAKSRNWIDLNVDYLNVVLQFSEVAQINLTLCCG